MDGACSTHGDDKTANISLVQLQLNGPVQRTKGTWEDNIKMNLKTQNREQWPLINTAMNLQVT
jgi:hypothetical protein